MMVNVFPCCARPCRRWMSRVKPPQVLSHLLLVVTVFAFAAPNVPNKFSGSNPHKSYLICFLWCAICFEYSGYPWEFRGTHEISFPGRKLSTSYLSWENGKSHEQSHHNPGKSWNIQMADEIQTADEIGVCSRLCATSFLSHHPIGDALFGVNSYLMSPNPANKPLRRIALRNPAILIFWVPPTTWDRTCGRFAKIVI